MKEHSEVAIREPISNFNDANPILAKSLLKKPVLEKRLILPQ